MCTQLPTNSGRATWNRRSRWATGGCWEQHSGTEKEDIAPAAAIAFPGNGGETGWGPTKVVPGYGGGGRRPMEASWPGPSEGSMEGPLGGAAGEDTLDWTRKLMWTILDKD